LPKSGNGTGTLQLALTGVNVLRNVFNGFNSTTALGDATIPDIENISGTNTITSDLIVTGTGGDGIAVQSDAGLLELAGTISTTLTYRLLELNGVGNGLISAPVANGPGGISFSLVKDGFGIWILTGTNTYSGNTTVNNGTLRINGSLLSGSSVKVGVNGTLSGAGTIGGAVTLSGAISPGNANEPGTLTTGAATWNGGGTYVFGLNNATNNSGQDLVNLNGALNLPATGGNPFKVKVISLTSSNTPGPVTGFVSSQNYQWTLATTSGGITHYDIRRQSLWIRAASATPSPATSV